MSKSTMIIDENGDKYWENEQGMFHREDGPAIEWDIGGTEWWQNGDRHRVDGPAIEDVGGSKQWWQNGKLHRTDGPAEEWHGTCKWFFKGKCLGNDLEGFWALWELLNEEERQNVNLHMWLIKLTAA